MKIFITGSEGFFGSHLTELLSKKNRITALIQYNSFHNYGWLKNLKLKNKKNIKFLFGDIRDQSFLQNAIKSHEIVINLAALISIPYSYKSPESYLDTNIRGTYNLLEACKHNNVKQFIHTSTSEVYGTAKYSPIDESHPLQPQSPYSATKISADNLALSYFYSYSLPVTILRPFNLFGPRQSTRAIIPTIITQALKNKNIYLGNINVTRDFNYVKDIAQGYEKAIGNKLTFGQVINLGSGHELTIKKLLELLGQLIGKKINYKIEKKRIRPKTSEVFRLIACSKKAKKLLNWQSSTTCTHSFKLALKKTLSWYKNNKNLDNFFTDDYNL